MTRTIRIVVNPDLVDKERNEAYQFCKESLENNLNLRNMFLNILDKDSLSVEVKTTIYNLLLTKTFRARYNFEQKAYIEKKLSKFATNSSTTAFRPSLEFQT